MKLTQKLEIEILKVYNTVWDAYLKGDMKTFASILDENCYIIGSAAGEVFKNKKAAVKYYKSTAEQITGKAEFRNRKIKVMPVEKGFMVNEEADFYLLIDDQWTFYGPGRISSLFHKKNNKWKVIHQHGSFPDSKTEEGEQVNTDKIKAENIQLRNAVKRRTEELENKNRELEIEAALERVRARAMAMQSSDELVEVANVMRQQMVELGQSGFDTAAVHLYSDDSEYFDSWYSFRQGDPVTGKIVTGKTKFKKDACKMLREMVKAYHSKQSDYTIKGSGEKLREWFSFLAKTIPEIKINLDKNPRSNYIHFSDFSGGSLVMATYEPPTKDSMLLQKRCAAVFDLAYRRYRDLKKAEAQAREAQIEASLERVRSRSMAMHHSNDLQDVIRVLSDQLLVLGLKFDTATFAKIHEDASWDLWISTPDQPYPAQVYVPYVDQPIFKDVNEAGKKKEKFFETTYTFEEKNIFFKYFFENTAAKNIPDERKQYVLNCKGFARSVFLLENIRLSIANYEGILFSKDENAMMQRFANVFEQSYTRFLDLQKAEAQAKEARIELALERVRARAMAMRNSNELAELVSTVFNELTQLDFRLTSCIIWIHDHENAKNTLWIASAEMNNSAEPFLVNAFHNDFFRSINHAWRSKDTKWIYTFTGKEKKNFEKAFFKELPQLPISLKNALEVPKQVVFSASFNNFGALEIVETEALTGEKFEILHRFGKVFDLSYTRFNDLKKAEAQAREAQIEAALERVRSRSMAMHKSDDLHEVIKVVTEQLSLLSVKFNVANFAKIDPDGSWNLWLSTPEQAYPALIHVPYIDHPIFSRITEEGTKKNDFFTDVYTREEANIFFHHFFENTIAKNTPEERKQFVYNSKGFARSIFLTKNIWFSVSRYDTTAFTDEENAIFKRFANVFEQAYTRFLDLQKAEAQARETEIELSLERVRAKTMAMQKPSEFVDVINIIGEQFVHLGFDIDWANFGANGLEISRGIDIWNFGVIPGASPISARVFIPYFDHPVFTTSAATINEFLNGGRDLITVTLDKQAKDTWLDHMFTKTIFKDVPGEYRVIQYAKPGYTTSNISLKDTWLSIGKFDIKNFTDEQHAILRRFANAFGQAYTRFLDLQKAEAQAREAQIEAGLERVRSRAMAMQTSEELNALIGTVFTELTKLDLVLTRCVIWILDKKTKAAMWWMANSEDASNPAGFYIKYHESHPYLSFLSEWEKQTVKWVYDLHGQVKEDWDDLLFSETELVNLPKFVQDGMRAPDRILLSATFNNFGAINVASLEPLSDEHYDILLRFAKVFDLTYTRFNDLKQAEAQTREAQIELALERVRARTMAMHKSEELAETAQVLFQQLSELGGMPDRISIGIADEINAVVNFWSTDQSGTQINRSFQASLNESTTIFKTYEAWKEHQKSLTIDLQGDELKSWIQYAREEMGIVVKDDHFKNRRVHHIAFFSHGWILVTTHQPQSAETLQILERFASVFNLTYRRFLDLQKAEAQAREAQIEMALEKIRSRSLAMHKSDELQEVVNTVFERLKDLDIEVDSSNIAIFKEGSRDFDYWIASNTQKRAASFHMPYIDLSLTKDIIAARESGADFSTTAYPFEIKNEWFDFAFKETDFKFLSEERKQFIFNSPGITVGIAFSKHTGVQVNRYSDKLLSKGEAEILKRFSKVFEQAYIRFLDLEKAEGQAREAQIEASLERVRASAMAMHRSDELSNVLAILFEQFDVLKIQPVDVHLDLFDLEKNTFSYRATGKEGKRVIAEQIVDLDSRPEWQALLQKWKNGKPNTVDFSYYPKEVISELMAFFPDIWAAMPEDAIMSPEDFPDGIFDALGYCKFGYIGFHHHRKATEEEQRILIRFANEFERLYQRFLDLQKAEAQARDAQIEASLERVRSKTMAMHNSEDVGDTVATMLDELVKLGVETVRCGIAIIDESKTMEVWTAYSKEDGGIKLVIGQLDMKTHPLFMQVYDAWKQKKTVTTYEMIGEDLKDYFRAINDSPNYSIRYDIETLPYRQSNTAFMFPEGSLFVFSQEPLVTETIQIFKRFAGVFGQTYRRYLDLLKAEANAREAQIEAGLERVRAKAMAMHSSKDLAETLSVFYRELKSLSVVPIRCGVALMDKESRMAELTTMNTTGEGDSIEIIGKIKMTGHSVLDGVFESWLVQKEYHAVLRGNQIKEYYQVLKPQIDYLDYSQDEAQFGYYFMFNEGDVYAWTEKELTEDELTIYRRFTTVISLTYKRYKDLQQAEAQAREAKIEAGLERVRSKTMAMHNSEDVGAATATMFTELEKLGIQNLRGGITIIKAGDKQEVWGITNLPDGRTIRSIGEFDMHLHALWRELLKAKVNNGDYNYYRLAGKDKEDYINILNTTPSYLSQPIKDFPDVHVQSYFFGEGAIWTNSLEPHSEEDKLVMKRFASVFSLTFRRYQDLKKAEAQTREATIETALEKVRGKAMAMHNSNDLTATASLVFTELRKLGINPMRCGVGMLNKENRKGLLYTAIASEEGDNLSQIGWVLLDVHPVLRSVYDHWIRGEDYFPVLKEEVLRSFYEQLKSGFEVPEEQTKYEHHGYFLPFSEGVFYGWSEKPFTELEIKVLKRFASVIDLTFRRYIELQKSEGNAREAVKQAALDRVRAEIASMRTINDLDRITPLIWNELTILGIPFIRCGVFIMDDEQELIHTFLSTPDGKAIAAFHLPYDTPGKLRHVVTNWKKNKKYIDHWDETEFIQFADILVKGGALISSELYLKTIPKGGFYLHFLPFLQGMLYVGNTTQLKQEEIELIQHVADAFSTAYARYEDFNKLESAKQQVEKTLTDLKQAQTQLVQSEKMASLGEMTAGIAHEIQNPLNFVNNFSEVSKELLDEMKTELETGNTEDAKGIADDVIQNLEKINHHGKRADAIVKSMLQHSRSSSGKKEPADINGLADEYLRLAYHGLRAKDKSFNAKFETEFDNNIGKINIISQDIGRVLVNLINNAFYAVSERKKQESNGYEPTVTVHTKKMDDKIEIKVSDNGNGIPKKVLDKIFQPFFTTKPTGQGTGLGLSLAYDIVTKGHGGELKVETKEGEGSEFIIQLPNQS